MTDKLRYEIVKLETVARNMADKLRFETGPRIYYLQHCSHATLTQQYTN